MISFLKKEGNSKIQETLGEYSFLKDLLIDGVRNNVKVLISRSDFDAFGYDLLVQIEGNENINKLQLKTVNGKATVWDIHKSLIEDENGNVVVIKITEKDDCLDFEYRALKNINRNTIISRDPIKNHSKKCKLKSSDIDIIEKDKLLEKILKYKQ